MNPEKLKKLQESVRIGGKGTPRRKKKIVHQTPGTDDKKLQSLLKKLAVNVIPGIEEVNMIKNDGTVIHFNNPKAQASLAANTFAITGHGETIQIGDNIPGILSQLDSDGLNQLKKFASDIVAKSKFMNEEEVPDLVINFEEVADKEAAASSAGGAATTNTTTTTTASSPEQTAAAVTETTAS